MRIFGLLILLLASMAAYGSTPAFCEQHSNVAAIPNPVLFVTMVPIPSDFGTLASTFDNHDANMRETARGGDLMIRHPSGMVCNLTREAGFGNDGFQGANAITVRDPAVHYSGQKAVFSMVVGAPSQQFQLGSYYWQLYEVTGLGLNEPVAITPVANQPTEYNNVGPIYGSDDRIIFSSDRPRGGQRHLWPQHDEYESSPTPTGLWSLNPQSGSLKLLQHSPSGSFDPIIDSYGRIIYTRWDHLMRDQQAAADAAGSSRDFGTFDYADETASAATTSNRQEYFPEPLEGHVPAGSNLVGSRLNHFFPWEINQDGTSEETLNHLGRHELHRFFQKAFTDDPNLIDFTSAISGRTNLNPSFNFFQMQEDPANAGRFIIVDAPEFNTHASGQIVALQANPGLNPDDAVIDYITHPDTITTTASSETPSVNHSGHYRDPVPLANGALIASHTFETRGIENEGTRANPVSRYEFRLRNLTTAGNGYLAANQTLTNGISRNITYYDPDVLVTFNGDMWEMHGVEVKAQTAPPYTSTPAVETPEQSAFSQAGVDEQELRSFLSANRLALMVVRNTTSRDDMDRQQPYNLRVPGGVASISSPGKVYDVGFFQIFQGDQVRGIGGQDNPDSGRRVLARPLNDAIAVHFNLPESQTGPGGATIAADGSVAAFVPAQRAMAWQATAPDGEPVVRERFWVTFQPGEIRVCDGCHGVNKDNQIGQPLSENVPSAMIELLQHWKSMNVLFESSFD